MGKMKTLWQWAEENSNGEEESFEIICTCDDCGTKLQPLTISTGIRMICPRCSKG